jgi:hypothetical protein
VAAQPTEALLVLAKVRANLANVTEILDQCLHTSPSALAPANASTIFEDAATAPESSQSSPDQTWNFLSSQVEESQGPSTSSQARAPEGSQSSPDQTWNFLSSQVEESQGPSTSSQTDNVGQEESVVAANPSASAATGAFDFRPLKVLCNRKVSLNKRAIINYIIF